MWDDGVERQLSVKVRWCVLDGVVSWGLGFGDGLGERGRWSFEVKGWWLVGETGVAGVCWNMDGVVGWG